MFNFLLLYQIDVLLFNNSASTACKPKVSIPMDSYSAKTLCNQGNTIDTSSLCLILKQRHFIEKSLYCT